MNQQASAQRLNPGVTPDVEVAEIAGLLSAAEWDFSSVTSARGAHCFVLAAGRGTLGLNNSHATLEAPCVIWLPSAITALVRLEAGTRGMMLTVSNAALGRVMPTSGLSGPLREAIDRLVPGLRIDAGAASLALRDLEDLHREMRDELPGMREAVTARLFLLLLGLWRLADVTTQPQASPRVLVEGFMQLVERNARAHWPVAEYARTMGISTDRLTTAIRRATGLSPLELVHGRLLEDAESLLERSTLQVREIADALGFRDAGYFNRFFSRLKGISPGRFRKRMQSLSADRNVSYAAWP